MTLLERLRRAAVTRTLGVPSDLASAIDRLEYVQADPIRAPARAQDLILRHRVAGYRAGDLERHYSTLALEEDFVQNYGFVPRRFLRLLHPRVRETPLKIEQDAPHLLEAVLGHVRQHGPTHPRVLEKVFGKLSVGNYWGGTSSASTRVLEGLHYRGLLRVARREGGIKVYEVAHPLEDEGLDPQERAQRLVHYLVRLYGPLPETSLSGLVGLLGYGVPHLTSELRAALKAAVVHDLQRDRLEGLKYVWMPGEDIALEPDGEVRLLAPFDPIVWDRRRFAHLWGWEYRFEAYTPLAKRRLGYYALPLLWQEQVVGYANLKTVGGQLEATFGYPLGQPEGRAFQKALERELGRFEHFLGR